MGKTPKEIREVSPGVGAVGQVVHVSTSESDNESLGVLTDDISRARSASQPFDTTFQYKIGDFILEGIFPGVLFRNKIPNTLNDAFDPLEWVNVEAGGGSLQDAYDNGKVIETLDTLPVKIKSPIGPASVFQPVIEIEDQDSNFPTTIEGGGQIRQKPFNLDLVNTINDGDGGILLSGVKGFEIHERLGFLANRSVPNIGVEIVSLANPEIPEHIHLITDGEGGSFVADVRALLHVGKILYVISVQSSVANFAIIDVSDPNNPVQLGAIATGTVQGSLTAQFGSTNKIIIKGRHAIIALGGTNPGFITVLDIYDPENIRIVNVITDGDSGSTGGAIKLQTISTIAQQRNILFVANSFNDIPTDIANIQAIDITDVTDLKNLSKIDDNDSELVPPFLQNVVTIHPTNDVVHVFSNGRKALQILDYADPTAPVSKGFLKDGLNSVVLGQIQHGIVEGRFVYMNYPLSGDMKVTTVDVQDSANPVILKETNVATAAATAGLLNLVGNHLYLVLEDDGPFFILSTSGIDTQAIRAGAMRAEDLELKNELSAQKGTFSENIVAGGEILAQSGIASSLGSRTKVKVINIVLPSGAQTGIDFDMSEDMTVFLVDATAITVDWIANVVNPRFGHKALIIAQFDTPVHADSINFTDAQFYIPETLPNFIGFEREMAELVCAGEDTSVTGSILAKCWKDGLP